MTTLILRRIKDHLVLAGPDIEPMQFKTRPHHAIEIEQPARSDIRTEERRARGHDLRIWRNRHEPGKVRLFAAAPSGVG